MKKFIIVMCYVLLLVSAMALNAIAGDRFATVQERWQIHQNDVMVEDQEKTTFVKIPECEVTKEQFNALKKEFKEYKRAHKQQHAVVNSRLKTTEKNVDTMFSSFKKFTNTFNVFAANSVKKFGAIDSFMGLILSVMSVIGLGAVIIGIGSLLQARKK